MALGVDDPNQLAGFEDEHLFIGEQVKREHTLALSGLFVQSDRRRWSFDSHLTMMDRYKRRADRGEIAVR